MAIEPFLANAAHSFESLEQRLALTAIQDWQIRGVGGGGALFSPSINPVNSNEIYIASDMGQVFHSTNEGALWETVDHRELHGSQNSKVQFTVNPQILYGVDYASGGDVVRPTKSTDGGVNWNPIAADPTFGEVITLAADYNNPNRLLVSDYSRLFISTDGGVTFAQRFSTADGAGIHVGGALFDGNNIYVGTNQGLLVSTNGGASFSVAAFSGIPSTQRIVSFAGAKENGVTRLWAVTAGAGDVYGGIQGWDHGGYAGVYRIDVGQTSWTPITSGIASGATPFFVCASMNDIDTVYVAGGSDSARPTVFRSTSGGGNWTSVLQTVNNANVQTGWSGDGGVRGWSYGENALGFSVSPLDSTRLIITDYGFAHYSEDSGASWRALYVTPDDLNPAGTSIPANQTYKSSGLENTTSWGLTWTDASHIIGSFSDIRGAVSNDGGDSWSFNYTGHTQNSMYRSIVHPTSGVVYAATASVHDMYQSTYLTDARIDGGTGNVLFSTNGGNTWQTMHNFGHVVTWVEADPTNPNRLYAAVAHSTDGGIYVTNNAQAGAASTWTKLANPPRTQGHAFNVRVLNDGTLVASYSGRRDASGVFTASSGVFVSTNGGQSWQDRSHTGMRYWTKDIVIDPHDATQNTWYAGVFSGWGGPPNGLGGLYKTTDRGQTWSRINSLDRVNSITVSPTNPNEAYLTTEIEGLWYTENLRAANPTFTQVAGFKFMQPMRVVYNPFDANEVWVTSFGGGLRVGNIAQPTGTPGSVALGQSTYTINETGGSLVVSVVRTGGSSGAVSVNYSTANGTAIAGQDFTAVSGSLSWANGETGAKTFSIPLLNDGLVENNETFGIAISNPTGGVTLGQPTSATVTLQSEDVPSQPGSIAFAQTNYGVNEANGSVTLSVTRSSGTTGAVSVSYATASGTATAGQDYTSTSGVLSWAAGEGGTKSFVVSLLNDGLFEANEAFSLVLSNVTGGAVLATPTTATVTVESDDPRPTLSFSTEAYQVSESSSQALVTIVRGGNQQGTVAVSYAATAGTAAAGSDFTPTSGTLTFLPGETQKSFAVSILGDTLDEVIETIQLALSSPSGGATISPRGQALLQILDDDELPPAAASEFRFEYAAHETRENYGYRSIYVRRSGDLSQPGSVQFATRNGTAVAGSDYLARSGTLQFAAGESLKRIDVKLVNNAVVEPTENLFVDLASPSGGVLGQIRTAEIRIVDDEINAPGVIQFDRATYQTREDYGWVNVYLQRTGGAVGAVTVNFAVAAGSATAGQDYQPVNTTVTFADGQTSASVKVPLINNRVLESNETATFSLTSATGGAVLGERKTAQLVIADDEINAPGTLGFYYSSFSTKENWGWVRVYVSRDQGQVGQVSVDYSTGGGTAVPGVHYKPVSGTLVFADGEYTKYFDVPLINNNVAGGTTNFEVRLTNPGGGAQLGARKTAVVTILDDETSA